MAASKDDEAASPALSNSIESMDITRGPSQGLDGTAELPRAIRRRRSSTSTDASPHHSSETPSRSSGSSVTTPKSRVPSSTRSRHTNAKHNAPKFQHLPDISEESKTRFEFITESIYSNKYIGRVAAAYECDCVSEWDPQTERNLACGPESNCINRATKTECPPNCDCGSECQNQQFLKKQYADISVIDAGKKGLGIRINAEHDGDTFIAEYIGEVIGINAMNSRRKRYHEQKFEHLYFMSLNGEEFIDATVKGGLARFLNHSCNPNCYIDKWIVGDRQCMGIFAKRPIAAGEELTFDYNVDRYGAEKQDCYCGEPTCKGYIGGKTQSGRAGNLSAQTIEALGFDDDEALEQAIKRKNRKKKTEEDEDDDYVEGGERNPLELDGVTKVMSSLRQCKDRWIMVQLLARLQRCDDQRALGNVLRLHGYEILKSILDFWSKDDNVTLQTLEILHKLPALARNKIEDSKIEESVRPFQAHENDNLSLIASEILKKWSELQLAYRIPRLQPGQNGHISAFQEDRRRRHMDAEVRVKSPSPEPPKSSVVSNAPTGPKHQTFRPRFPRFPVPPFSRNMNAIQNGQSTPKGGSPAWPAAMMAAASTSPATPKRSSDQERPTQASELERIIKEAEDAHEAQQQALKSSAAPNGDLHGSREHEKSRDRSHSSKAHRERKKYENVLHPFLKEVVDEYNKERKLSKDTLKSEAKKASFKIAERDLRDGFGPDTLKIDTKKAEKIKAFARKSFDAAIAKRKRDKIRNAGDALEVHQKRKRDDSETQDIKTPHEDLVDSPDSKRRRSDSSVPYNDDENREESGGGPAFDGVSTS